MTVTNNIWQKKTKLFKKKIHIQIVTILAAFFALIPSVDDKVVHMVYHNVEILEAIYSFHSIVSSSVDYCHCFVLFVILWPFDEPSFWWTGFQFQYWIHFLLSNFLSFVLRIDRNWIFPFGYLPPLLLMIDCRKIFQWFVAVKLLSSINPIDRANTNWL